MTLGVSRELHFMHIVVFTGDAGISDRISIINLNN